MKLQDLHTHTTYCDGKDSPEDMIKAAIEKGLDTIGFSGHIYMAHGESFCIAKEEMPKYIAEINELKEKYSGKIKVLCGIEADLYSNEELSCFDYVIGSVHDIKCGDEFICVDHTADIYKSGVEKYFGGDMYAAAEEYFASVAKCIKKTDADIIGHFDLITKFNEKEKLFDETHPRYVAAYKKAIDEIIPLGKVFEINTGVISRGYRTSPYPSHDILSYIAQKGGRVIITGDTHKKEKLCCEFAKGIDAAKKAGFETICTAEDIIR